MAGTSQRKVLIQAGHSAAFVPFQAGGGGAPGEAEWVTDLAKRLAARLSTRGVDVTLVGCWNLDNSNAPAAVTKQDYALALSLHYDAAVYGAGKNTGCFADRARGDPMGAEADRFIALWEPRYTRATGLALHNERRNPNTWDYYAWRATTDQTPGVLIEHGVGPEAELDTAADADAAAVLAFLDVVPAVPIVAPLPPPPATQEPDAAMTKEQEDVLALLELRQITTAQQVQELYDWTDETVKERDDLAREVAGLRTQLQAAAGSPAAAAKLAQIKAIVDG